MQHTDHPQKARDDQTPWRGAVGHRLDPDRLPSRAESQRIRPNVWPWPRVLFEEAEIWLLTMRLIYRFGVFEFDAATGRLCKKGRFLPLEPQPARALARLLLRAGTLVTRDEMKDAVWGSDIHVDFDRGLAYCLSQIRAALGDSGENPRFVQTLPRKGYKFIAPLIQEDHDVASEPGAASDSGISRREATRRTVTAAAWMVLLSGLAWLVLGLLSLRTPQLIVAVSVFDNESGRPEYDRLVAGLSDLVVERLTKIDPEQVAVVGNAAVLRQPRNLRNLGAVKAGLHADYVILGQLQEAEAGLRFISHLIRLSDETHLKANRLSFPDGDLSGLEAAVVSEADRAIRENVLTSLPPHAVLQESRK